MSVVRLAGLGLTATAALAAQAAEAGSEVTPWVSGGGMATLAGVLLYLFKQFLSGNLVSRSIAERLREAEVVNAASMEREDRLQTALLAANRREDASARREAALARKLEDANRALFRATEALEEKAR